MWLYASLLSTWLKERVTVRWHRFWMSVLPLTICAVIGRKDTLRSLQVLAPLA
jgi:hypothetical protein